MTRSKKAALAAAFGAFAALSLVATSVAAGGQLKTFGTGEVTTAGDSATIVIDTGEFGGVFKRSKPQANELVGDAVFSFTSRGDAAGGAPRWSIPINDGSFDPNTDFAFIDAPGCGATVGDNPGNAATLVSTQNPACHVHFHGVDYANWTVFAESNPTFRIARATPFIIADAVPPGQSTGTFVVTDTHFG